MTAGVAEALNNASSSVSTAFFFAKRSDERLISLLLKRKLVEVSAFVNQAHIKLHKTNIKPQFFFFSIQNGQFPLRFNVHNHHPIIYQPDTIMREKGPENTQFLGLL